MLVENYAHLISAPPGGAAPPNLLLLRCRCFIAKNEVIKLYEMSYATKGYFPLWRKINDKSWMYQRFGWKITKQTHENTQNNL